MSDIFFTTVTAEVYTIDRVQRSSAGRNVRRVGTSVLFGFVAATVLAGVTTSASVWSQGTLSTAAAPTSVWAGVFSDAQARRGEQIYTTECSYCHRDDLGGGFFDDGLGRAPALAGRRAFDSSLIKRWGGLTLADMVGTVAATMPQPRPSSLTLANYVDVVSYILMKNDVPSGSSELSGDVDALSNIAIGPRN